jgi:hypothetical protein
MALAVLLCVGTSAFAQNSTIFGPNVYVFTPSDSVTSINATLNTLNTNSQFSTNRDAVLFMPGTYTGVESEVGYYESVAGLGETPSAVHISNGYLNSNQTDSNGNITTNFWRSIENMQITAPSGTYLQWGVSQGAAFRRMYVDNGTGLELTNTNCGYASGGFISNSQIKGELDGCSQQQWYTRNSTIGSFVGNVWNFVFSGVTGAPAQSSPFGQAANANTVLATTPASREKPYLYVDSNSNYNVFVPTVLTNSSGTDWTANGGLGTGYSLPISDFYIASAGSSAEAINDALAAGQNLILTPGIYQLDESINITNPNTIVLGLGYATLVSTNGNPAITVADVDGVQIAGLILDAGPVTSTVQLQIGVPGAPRASHQANPTSINDVYFRIGGATVGSTLTSMEVDSDNVILDNIWAWRADHGAGASPIWTGNPANTGLIVNGDNVLATGLAVEHYEQNQVIWNGDGGEDIFYQSEMPYDVPSQAAWMNGSLDGYASFAVSSNVLTFQGYGMGVYSYFDQGIPIYASSGITVPNTPGVMITDAVTVFLNGSGGITNVVDQAGAEAYVSNGVSDLSSYGGVACTTGCPTTPAAPTNVVATGVSSTQINVTWTASTTSGVLYNVYRSTASGFTPSSANLIGTGISSTSFADIDLTAATTYYYVVEATNGAGSSVASSQATGLTLPVTVATCTTLPTVPIAVSAENTSSTVNNVTWGFSTAPAACTVTYNLYRSTSKTATPSSSNQIATGMTLSSYSDTGLSNPTQYYYAVVAVDSVGASAATAWAPVTSLANWTLVWGDDFTGAANTAFNTANWSAQVVDNTGQNPFGDGTIMSTTDSLSNVYLDGNGNLVIAMTYDAATGAYDSARLNSVNPVGPYGRIEARIMNPWAAGMGAAFWALGADNRTGTPWPNCGELDIMESQAKDPGHTGSTIHGFETDSQTNYEYGGLSQGVDLPSGEQLNQAFHIYTVQWAPYHIQYFLDGVQYADESISDLGAADVWELNQPINFILSSGIGGNGGTPDGLGFPANLYFDYVHYYQWAAGAPNPVTNLAATAASSNSVNLSWTASTTAGVTYDIYASTTSGFTPGLSTLVASQVSGTSYLQTGLLPSTTYYYTVAASNFGGESAASNTSVATSAAGNSTGLQLSAAGYAAGSYMASNYVTGGNTNYHFGNVVNVAQVTNPAPQLVYDTERWAPATWTIPGFNAGGNYSVRLHFVEDTHNAAGVRNFNVAINGTTVLTNFDIFALAGAMNTAVTQEFAATADATGTITIATQAGTSTKSDLNPTISAIEITPAVAGTCAGEPYAPATVTATANSGFDISVSWAAVTPPTNCSVTYTVYGGTAAIPTTVVASGLTGTSFDNTGLTENTTYYYTVVANDAVGASAESAVASTTTLKCAHSPAAPATISATANSGSDITISWAAAVPPANCSVTSYTIYGGTTANPTTVIADNVTGLSYDNTGLTPLTTYYYIVAGKDQYGLGKDSAQASTETLAQSCTAVTSAPTGLTMTAATASSVSLSWTAPATIPTGCTVSSYVINDGTSTPPTVVAASGIAGTTYTVSGLAANTAYYFTVAAVDGFGTSSASGIFSGTTQSAPAITTQPVAQTVTAGQTATFSVVATGNPAPTYQWYMNSAAISGATAASYTTPVTTTANSGESFYVVVTNSNGSATSNTVTLTVNAATVAPAITTQPVAQTVTAGQTATFSVVATGNPAPTYQWYKNSAAISGATAASYTTPATVSTDNGATFYVVVTNSVGSVTSSTVTLTVNTAPAITTQPAAQTVTAGQTATFSVVATGNPAPTYQWYKNSAAISGATAASYTTPATVSTDNGATFYVVVTNSVGSVTSSTATLTVNVAPTITTQPVAQTVTAGQTATFSVVATGTPAPTYQWYKNSAAISGATAASYTTPATVSTDNGATFYVVVTNSAGSITSSTVTLTVNSAPAITTQPAAQTVTAGATATFSVVATGTPAPTYQWYMNSAAISGATASSYTTPATTTANSGESFYVVVTNIAGSVTSSTVTLTVNPATVKPTITTQPVSQTVTAGATATFSVVATGTPAPTYQWYMNSAAISGATATSYTTPATTTANSGETFYVVVTNSAGSVTSNTVTLTVNPPPCAAVPSAPVATVGTITSSSIALSWTEAAAPANCSITSYSVYTSTGTLVASGLTSTSYTVTGLAASTAYSYYVVAVDAYGTSKDSATVKGTTSAACAAVPSAPVVTLGAITSNSIALSWTEAAAPSHCSITSYSVYTSAGTLVTSGLTSTSYTVTGLAATTAYSYYVVAIDAYGTSKDSATVSGTTQSGTTFTDFIAIAAGGPAISNATGGDSSFVADVDFSGGSDNTHTTNTINLTQPGVNAAPMAVYQYGRAGVTTYTIPGLVANSSHTVLLHFSENYYSAAGKREFNVAINGTPVLTNFDIYATAGAEYKAVVETFTATANSAGDIVIAFTKGADNQPLIMGIEIR